MSEMYDEDSTDESGEGMVPRSQIRQLEKKAKQVDELSAQLAALQRKDAFREAGVDLTDPKAGYFVKGYDGEISPEAIRKAAEEAGFIQPPPPRSEEQEQVLTAEQRMAAAAAGAPAVDSATEDKIRAEMVEAQRTGGTAAMLDVARQYGAVISDDLM